MASNILHGQVLFGPEFKAIPGFLTWPDHAPEMRTQKALRWMLQGYSNLYHYRKPDRVERGLEAVQDVHVRHSASATVIPDCVKRNFL